MIVSKNSPSFADRTPSITNVAPVVAEEEPFVVESPFIKKAPLPVKKDDRVFDFNVSSDSEEEEKSNRHLNVEKTTIQASYQPEPKASFKPESKKFCSIGVETDPVNILDPEATDM